MYFVDSFFLFYLFSKFKLHSFVVDFNHMLIPIKTKNNNKI